MEETENITNEGGYELPDLDRTTTNLREVLALLLSALLQVAGAQQSIQSVLKSFDAQGAIAAVGNAILSLESLSYWEASDLVAESVAALTPLHEDGLADVCIAVHDLAGDIRFGTDTVLRVLEVLEEIV